MAGAPQSKACERCGNPFLRARLSDAQWSGRRFCSKRCSGMRRHASDEDIRARYAAGKSTNEIAEDIGLSGVHVSRIIRAYEETRPASERQRLSHARPQVKQKLSAASLGRPCSERVKDALRSVFGRAHPLWRGGLTMSAQGYRVFTASPANGEDAGRGQHVVIAERAIGRRIQAGEHVHHKDHNKQNNDPANLAVMPHAEHARYHANHQGLGKRHVPQ